MSTYQAIRRIENEFNVELIEAENHTAYERQVARDPQLYLSRYHYGGANGFRQEFTLDDFVLHWETNFVYRNHGAVWVALITRTKQEIHLKQYDNVTTTQAFVDLLNKYATFTVSDFKELLGELASATGYYREILDENRTRMAEWGRAPRRLYPHGTLDEVNRFDRDCIQRLQKRVANEEA